MDSESDGGMGKEAVNIMKQRGKRRSCGMHILKVFDGCMRGQASSQTQRILQQKKKRKRKKKTTSPFDITMMSA